MRIRFGARPNMVVRPPQGLDQEPIMGKVLIQQRLDYLISSAHTYPTPSSTRQPERSF